MASENPAVQDDLNPTRRSIRLTLATAGYQPGEKKSLQEYAALDAEDESLRRWKESLGITAGGSAPNPNEPKVRSETNSAHDPLARVGKRQDSLGEHRHPARSAGRLGTREQEPPPDPRGNRVRSRDQLYVRACPDAASAAKCSRASSTSTLCAVRACRSTAWKR